VTSPDLLSKHLLTKKLHFDAVCTLTWVTKILMRVIPNVHAGTFPTPGLWHSGLKHYILYCLENDNFKTA